MILSRSDVASILSMKECMTAVEMAFRELSEGTAIMPLRTAITTPDGLALYMPAYLKQMGALACKVVTVYKNNPAKHKLPTTIGKVLLQDRRPGMLSVSWTADIYRGAYGCSQRCGNQLPCQEG